MTSSGVEEPSQAGGAGEEEEGEGRGGGAAAAAAAAAPTAAAAASAAAGTEAAAAAASAPAAGFLFLPVASPHCQTLPSSSRARVAVLVAARAAIPCFPPRRPTRKGTEKGEAEAGRRRPLLQQQLLLLLFRRPRLRSASSSSSSSSSSSYASGPVPKGAAPGPENGGLAVPRLLRFLAASFVFAAVVSFASSVASVAAAALALRDRRDGGVPLPRSDGDGPPLDSSDPRRRGHERSKRRRRRSGRGSGRGRRRGRREGSREAQSAHAAVAAPGEAGSGFVGGDGVGPRGRDGDEAAAKVLKLPAF